MEPVVPVGEDGSHWHRLVSTFLTELPELAGVLARWEIEEPVTPGDVWTTISLKLLSDDGTALDSESDLWPRLLRLLEAVEELRDLLEQTDTHSEEDVLTLDVFANAGLLCDITRSRVCLERLLPWMGPRTVEAARGEVEGHDRVHKNWGGRDVDWDIAGTAFRRADVDPASLRPERASD